MKNIYRDADKTVGADALGSSQQATLGYGALLKNCGKEGVGGGLKKEPVQKQCGKKHS